MSKNTLIVRSPFRAKHQVVVHGKVAEMSPALSLPTPLPLPNPLPPNPTPDPLPHRRQGGQGGIGDITGKGFRTAVALSTASCLYVQASVLPQGLNAEDTHKKRMGPCSPSSPLASAGFGLCVYVSVDTSQVAEAVRGRPGGRRALPLQRGARAHLVLNRRARRPAAAALWWLARRARSVSGSVTDAA